MRKLGRRKHTRWFLISGFIAVCLVLSLPAILGATSMWCRGCGALTGAGVALLVSVIVFLGWRYRPHETAHRRASR